MADVNTITKSNGHATKAAKKAAKAERNRLAALKRQENRQSRLLEQEVGSEACVERSGRSLRSDIREEEEGDDDEEPAQLQVNAVDNIDSFKRFNVGWVLPHGSKRTRNKPTPDVIGQSETGISRSQSHASALSKTEAVQRRQAGKRRLSQLDDSIAAAVEMPSKKRASKLRSELPVLGSGALTNGTTRRSSLRNGMSQSKAVKGERNESFEHGMLCWAKLEGHPFFPAEVQSQSAADIPKHVFRSQPKANGNVESVSEAMYLVRFFDEAQSYGWINDQSKIRVLLEDDDLDARMLKAAKASKARKDIINAYARAKSKAA